MPIQNFTTADNMISLEGGEGVGKTTAIDAIRRVLAPTGREVVLTREPGGTALGEQLRAILLAHSDTRLQGSAELLMMFAARAQHIAEVIQPALDRGAYVICDRFTDSSYVYQGYGRGIAASDIAELESRFVGFRPSLTLLLDAPVEVSRIRTAGRGVAPDRIEAEGDAFFERIRGGFLAQAKADPDRVKVINTDQEYRKVIGDITHMVGDWLVRTGAPQKVAAGSMG